MTSINPHASPRVLLVDPSEETRAVLRFALERRGIEILEAEEPKAGLDLLRRRHPEVVVLDLDTSGDEDTIYHEFDEAAESHAGYLVILGKLRDSAGPSDLRRCFAKPYHFAPLIHKIEELLAGS
jgi:CheY-like chemotaxis protein